MIDPISIQKHLGPLEVSPHDAKHFMWIDAFALRIRVSVGDVQLADTINPRRVTEFASKLLEPVLYIPKADLTHQLQRLEQTSFCPLKGQATYWSIPDGQSQSQPSTALAWSYEDPVREAGPLTGMVAFFSERVSTLITAVDG